MINTTYFVKEKKFGGDSELYYMYLFFWHGATFGFTVESASLKTSSEAKILLITD